MLTDYVLTVACVFFAASIVRRAGRRRRSRTGLWVAGFGTTAIAALAGGTAHGFRAPLGELWPWIWGATVVAIGVAAALLITAGLRSAFAPETVDERARVLGISWLRRAVGWTLVATAVVLAGVSFHRHFNQNDLYHVLQLVGLYCLYRGALELHNLEERDGAAGVACP